MIASEKVMAESWWLTSDDLGAMLPFVTSERKLRLFACGCCRRIWHLIKHPSCRQAVELAEDFADGAVLPEHLEEMHSTAQNSKPLFADASWAAAWSAAPDPAQAAEEAALNVAQSVARVTSEPAKSRAMAAVCSGATEVDRQAAWEHYETVLAQARTDEGRAQADLLREIVGNPFQPVAWPEAFPLAVVDLAESLYLGNDCAFALHDALIETGHADLAQHFADPARQHPKGCWVLDGLLGVR